MANDHDKDMANQTPCISQIKHTFILICGDRDIVASFNPKVTRW
jgi:hypothetical protein